MDKILLTTLIGRR